METEMKTILVASAMVLTTGTTVLADDYTLGDLVISNPVIRATPAKAPVSGGYMLITNNGSEPDRLIGGSVLFAKSVEVHEMKMEGDVMKMRQITGLPIAPGDTVKLMPGGFHVMFMDLEQQLKAGETFKGTLEFENAGTVEVKFNVEPLNEIRKSMGALPAMKHSGHMQKNN